MLHISKIAIFECAHTNLLYDYTLNILGGSVSNALGSIAVVYSSLYLLFGQAYEPEDEAKTCVTGAATGILLKSEPCPQKRWLKCLFYYTECGTRYINFQLIVGLLYKSSSGIKSCAKGGAFGLGAAAIWAFLLKKDQRISDYI